MKLKSILKQTTALTLSLTLYVNDSMAMELEPEESKCIHLQTTTVDDLSQSIELESKEITSSSWSPFSMSEELCLYNESCNAVQHLLSVQFKDSLNNLFTWVAYNRPAAKVEFEDEGKKTSAMKGSNFLN